MIEVDIIKKKRTGTAAEGGSAQNGTTVVGSGGDAQHAINADEAQHAQRADEAGHAASAKELDGGSSVWNTIRTWISNAGEALKDVFLRKDQDDETTHKLTMGEAHVKGNSAIDGDETVGGKMTSGSAVVNGGTETKTLTVTDSAQTKSINNTDTITTKDLVVTGLAHFFQLIIDKVKAAGGAVFFTPADGFDVDYVKSVNGGYKLYWRCQDGAGKQRDNMWRVNDQALCKSFNRATVGTAYSASNKYYWALVTSVSTTSSPETVEGVGACHWIVISTTTCAGTVNPEVGDSIVMCGYRGTDDAARQSAIYISAYVSMDSGLSAPLLAQYRGIKDFDLASHRKSYFDASKARFVGDFETSDGVDLLTMIQQKVDSITLMVGRAAGKGNMLSGGKCTGEKIASADGYRSGYYSTEIDHVYTISFEIWKEPGDNVISLGLWDDEVNMGHENIDSYNNTSKETHRKLVTAYGDSSKMYITLKELTSDGKTPSSYAGFHVNWVRVDEGDWTTEPNVKTEYEDTIYDQLKDRTGIDILQGVINLIAGKVNFVGSDGYPYIRVSQDEGGFPHLVFVDPRTGKDAYDLGYTGFSEIIQTSEKCYFEKIPCLLIASTANDFTDTVSAEAIFETDDETVSSNDAVVPTSAAKSSSVSKITNDVVYNSDGSITVYDSNGTSKTFDKNNWSIPSGFVNKSFFPLSYVYVYHAQRYKNGDGKMVYKSEKAGACDGRIYDSPNVADATDYVPSGNLVTGKYCFIMSPYDSSGDESNHKWEKDFYVRKIDDNGKWVQQNPPLPLLSEPIAWQVIASKKELKTWTSRGVGLVAEWSGKFSYSCNVRFFYEFVSDDFGYVESKTSDGNMSGDLFVRIEQDSKFDTIPNLS